MYIAGLNGTQIRILLKSLPVENRTCSCGHVFITRNFCFLSQGCVVCDARIGCGKHHRIKPLVLFALERHAELSQIENKRLGEEIEFDKTPITVKQKDAINNLARFIQRDIKIPELKSQAYNLIQELIQEAKATKRGREIYKMFMDEYNMIRQEF